MSCPAYWNRRVKNELTPAFPIPKIIQARCYFATKIVGSVEVPPVTPDPGDPIKQMMKFLKTTPDHAGLILMYHRAGGFSHIRVNAGSP